MTSSSLPSSLRQALSSPVLERLPASEFRRNFSFDPIQYWAYAPERDSSVGAVELGDPTDRQGGS
jgi:hypothetical protein